MFVPIDDYDIFVEIDGAGPYMIMTHGLGSGSNAFQPLTEVLSPEYTVVRIDWPGHGHSSLSKSGEKFSMQTLVKVLEGVMDYFEMPDAILIGHSAGGISSMMLAAQSPNRVQALAVVGAGRTRATGQPEAKAFTLGLAKEARELGTAVSVDARVQYNIPDNSSLLPRALLRAITAMTSPEGYAQMCEALCADSHVDPDYSQIVCPACVIGGRSDAISPIAVTDELVGLIATSGNTPERHLLNTGHMMIIEDVTGMTDAIKGMLAKVT